MTKHTKEKLTKEQENRFNERFPNGATSYMNSDDDNVWLFEKAHDVREIKQFLANELARREDEIVEELEGMEVDIDCDGWCQATKKAIKVVKKHE